MSDDPNKKNDEANKPSREDQLEIKSAVSSESKRDNLQRKSEYSTQDEVSAFLNRNEGGSYVFYPGTERLDFNYEDERISTAHFNLIQSIAQYTKGSLGIGILCMHEAYMFGGLWASLVGNFIIGLLCGYCSFILVKSAQIMYHRAKVPALSYSDLAEMVADTGPCSKLQKHKLLFRHTVDLFLLLESSGTCCIYHVVISAILKHVLAIDNYVSDFRIFILFSIPLILPLSMFSSIRNLAPFSILADLIIGLCIIATQYYSLQDLSNVSQRPAWKSVHGYTYFVGICLYCVSGVAIALPVENNMKRPRYFNAVLWIGSLIVVSSIAITGFFGYWAWGEHCISPIVFHMPRDAFTISIQVLLLIMLSITYTLQFYMPIVIIWYYAKKILQTNKKIYKKFFRLGYFLLLTGVVIINHDLIPIIVFVGFFFHGIIAIAVPALLYYLVTYREASRWRAILNFSLFVLGIICCLNVTCVVIE